MTHSVLEVTERPAKGRPPASRNQYRQPTHNSLRHAAGALEATINQLEEQGDDGVAFMLWGQLASSDLRGAYFTASYNCASRTGRLALKQAT
jgi:hypothetical protein